MYDGHQGLGKWDKIDMAIVSETWLTSNHVLSCTHNGDPTVVAYRREWEHDHHFKT